MVDAPPEIMRSVTVERCPVCGGTGPRVHDDVADHWFGCAGSWGVRRCDGCQSLWLDPRPRPEDLPLAYRRYYTHGAARPAPSVGKRIVGLLPSHRDDEPGARCWLPPGPGTALDVGCGDGRTIQALRTAGWTVRGLDIDPESIRACREIGLDAEVGSIDELDPGERFDAVVAVHVIEHVEDPAHFASALLDHVRPGGRLRLVTPNAQGWRAGRDGPLWRGLEAPRHLQVFSPGALTKLLRDAGAVEVQAVTSPRGTNGLVRASRAAGRDRHGTPIDRVVDGVAGELAQLWSWARLAAGRAGSGDELVVTARASA